MNTSTEDEYLARLASVPKPEGMKLEIRYGQEGPSHDPYGWTEYRVEMADGLRAMYREADLSETLVITYPNGSSIGFRSPEYDGSDPSMLMMFTEITGHGLEQLQYWDNEYWQQFEDIREAELAAGWDPNP